MSRRALLAGATGLIGSRLLPRLLADPRYERVTVLGRRAPAASHPRLAVQLSDFDDLGTLDPPLQADDVYCCLGTTMARAGSKEAFERVDYGMVLDLARAAQRAGSRQFLVVSAAGSSPDSPAFYSRTKGRMEQALRELGFEALHILRPSLLLGARAESRPAERLAQKLAPLAVPLLQGRLARYRPVEADTVAAAMHHAAFGGLRGVQLHEAPFVTGTGHAA